MSSSRVMKPYKSLDFPIVLLHRGEVPGIRRSVESLRMMCLTDPGQNRMIRTGKATNGNE